MKKSKPFCMDLMLYKSYKNIQYKHIPNYISQGKVGKNSKLCIRIKRFFNKNSDLPPYII